MFKNLFTITAFAEPSGGNPKKSSSQTIKGERTGSNSMSRQIARIDAARARFSANPVSSQARRSRP